MSKTAQKWRNTLQAALDPAKGRVMVEKLWRRVSDTKGSLSPEANNAWLKKNAQDIDTLLAKIPGEIHTETKEFTSALDRHAKTVLSTIPHDLGGGGGVPLLYALTRLRKPASVIETGVAAGFSSASFLSAMKQNGSGHLYSSDFPYFRIAEPEKYVGVVVADDLRGRWSLFLEGDRANLPKIVSQLTGKVGLFHYDSDKSYDGRTYALDLVRPLMAEDGLIVMDDIQDNSFFHDWVAREPAMPWAVYAYNGKYIGVVGYIS